MNLFDLDRIPGGVAALPDILKALEAEHYLGTNVTYPVKQTVLPLLDDYSDDVRALGACNTVVLAGGKRRGHNTDWTRLCRKASAAACPAWPWTASCNWARAAPAPPSPMPC